MSEDSRGLKAASPLKMPKDGWVEIFKRVNEERKNDHCDIIAAGMAFYGLLSIFPSMIAIVSIYGLFADATEVPRHLQYLDQFLPSGVLDLFAGRLKDLAETSNASLSIGFIGSILAALWGSTKGTKALIKGMNIAYDEDETRSFVKLTLLALGLSFGLVAAVITALFLIAGLPTLLAGLNIQADLEQQLSLLRWPFLALALMAAIAALNRYCPDRDHPRWRWVSVGSVIATVAWLLLSLAFSVYVENFASYNQTYGNLGSVIVLLLWLHFSALIILLGAELNSELEFQTEIDTTVGPAEPMGKRGAIKADQSPRREKRGDRRADTATQRSRG